MSLLFMLIGAALGAFVCAGMFEESTGWTAAVFGAIVGLLIGQLRTLRARVARLEQAAQRAGETAAATSAPPGSTSAVAAEIRLPATAAAVPEPAAASIHIDSAATSDATASATDSPTLPPAVSPRAAEPPRATGSEPFTSAPVVAAAPTAGARASAPVTRWVNEGHVPGKVGG